MKRLLRMSLLAVGMVTFCHGTPARADMSLSPTSATSFQNEPSFQSADHTSLLTELDNQWAPSPIYDSYPVNYYATGNSAYFWDAVSLSFDLNQIGVGHHVVSAKLRFYAQQGTYINPAWHSYEILEGAFNTTDEDTYPSSGMVDFGDYGNNYLIGWLETPIPMSWITSKTFDVTLRLWNARIDKVELDVVRAPLPGAVILGLFGFGSAGMGLVRCQRRRRTAIDA
jgi:hypothetical protein